MDEARVAMRARNLESRHSTGVTMRTRLVGSMILASRVKPILEAHDLCLGASVRLDLAEVALALAAYKAERGEYPARLAELAGEYLDEVPLDRYSGRGFIYSRRDEGYMLYSVGHNATSDGGAIQEYTGDDIVIQSPVPAPQFDDRIELTPPRYGEQPEGPAEPNAPPAPIPGGSPLGR
jgi:hypothetical protein